MKSKLNPIILALLFFLFCCHDNIVLAKKKCTIHQRPEATIKLKSSNGSSIAGVRVCMTTKDEKENSAWDYVSYFCKFTDAGGNVTFAATKTIYGSCAKEVTNEDVGNFIKQGKAYCYSPNRTPEENIDGAINKKVAPEDIDGEFLSCYGTNDPTNVYTCADEKHNSEYQLADCFNCGKGRKYLYYVSDKRYPEGSCEVVEQTLNSNQDPNFSGTITCNNPICKPDAPCSPSTVDTDCGSGMQCEVPTDSADGKGKCLCEPKSNCIPYQTTCNTNADCAGGLCDYPIKSETGSGKNTTKSGNGIDLNTSGQSIENQSNSKICLNCEPTPAQPTMSAVTPGTSEEIGIKEETSHPPTCLGSEACSKNDVCPKIPVEQKPHTVRLFPQDPTEEEGKDAKPLIPETNYYVAECFPNKTDGQTEIKYNLCTLGRNKGMQFGIEDGEAFKKRVEGYQFIDMKDANYNSISNPIKTDKEGKFSIFWTSATKDNVARIFVAIPEPSRNNKEVPAGQAIKLGTYQSSNKSKQKSCIPMAWDPYGRLFDSYTLEPISDAKVTLLSQQADGSYEKAKTLPGYNQTNPQYTNYDGYFNFVVPDGNYKIVVEHPDYEFPANPLFLNPKAYDLYNNIYYGDVIEQRGEGEHRDIPMLPRNKVKSLATMQSKQIKFLNLNENIDEENNKYTLFGKVSHPRGTVSAYSDSNRLIGRVQTFSNGEFNLSIDLDQLRPGESIGEIKLMKYPLVIDTPQDSWIK